MQLSKVIENDMKCEATALDREIVLLTWEHCQETNNQSLVEFFIALIVIL